MLAKVIYDRWECYPIKVVNCLCEDGKRRVVTITGDCMRGSIHYKGTRITGFVIEVVGKGWNCSNGDYKFLSYTFGKNAHLMDDAILLSSQQTFHPQTFHPGEVNHILGY